MSGLKSEVSPAEGARVSRTVVEAAFSLLLEQGRSPFEAAGLLSGLGASRASLEAAVSAEVPAPDVFAVEVEVYTHDALRVGLVRVPRVLGGADFTTVFVSERDVRSDSEAMLVAAQMAGCTSGGMPTATRLVSFPM